MNDDSHALRFVREALTRAGYAVQVTAEPSEIAAIVRSKEPRVVLLDLMLPGTGSIDLMTEITELSDLPAIFISGYGRDDTIACAFEGRLRRLNRQAVLANRDHRAGPGGASRPPPSPSCSQGWSSATSGAGRR